MAEKQIATFLKFLSANNIRKLLIKLLVLIFRLLTIIELIEELVLGEFLKIIAGALYKGFRADS
ncbi:hypothetical protein HYD50_00810 [Mycoplasmopsis bovis]|nr:hypothetical protein [Mycoplasmopsis bovis]QQH72468.1 hypothetical protein HYD50_00810 [Mycoplasmopsis bovis]